MLDDRSDVHFVDFLKLYSNCCTMWCNFTRWQVSSTKLELSEGANICSGLFMLPGITQRSRKESQLCWYTNVRRLYFGVDFHHESIKSSPSLIEDQSVNSSQTTVHSSHKLPKLSKLSASFILPVFYILRWIPLTVGDFQPWLGNNKTIARLPFYTIALICGALLVAVTLLSQTNHKSRVSSGVNLCTGPLATPSFQKILGYTIFFI